jgi:hypothetical protein
MCLGFMAYLIAEVDAPRALELAEQAIKFIPGAYFSQGAWARVGRVQALITLGRQDEARREAVEEHAQIRALAAQIQHEAWRRAYLEVYPPNARLARIVGELTRDASADPSGTR